jgi:hypothetical protein
MDDDPHVTLPVPRPPTSAFDWDDDYIALPTGLVDDVIAVLRCYLLQWRQCEGNEPEDQTQRALAVATGHALASLLASRAANNTLGGAPQLIDQIARFFCWRDAREYLETLRTRGDTADIVDALLALYEERQRRGKEPLPASGVPERAVLRPEVQV